MVGRVQIRVQYLGKLREIFGKSEETLVVEPSQTVFMLRKRLFPKKTEQASALASELQYMVNMHLASLNTVLKDGDEVIVSPKQK